MLKNNERGTLIIEASFSLVIFIAGIASIISLINVVMVHNKVQHVINQTAKEIAAYGYIYDIATDELKPLLDGFIEGFTADSNVDSMYDDNSLVGNILTEIKEATSKQAINQVVKVIAEKYFGNTRGESESADKYLQAYRVKDGLKGLDFSDSILYQSEGKTGHETVEICVEYIIEHDFPLTPFPVKEIYMKQKVATRAWIDGDGTSYSNKGKGTSEK